MRAVGLRVEDDLPGDGAGLGEPQGVGRAGQGQSGGDLRGDLTATEGGEDLCEVGAQPGPEPVPGQRAATPDVEEVGVPAVGQGVPQPYAAEQLEHGPLLGPGVVAGG